MSAPQDEQAPASERPAVGVLGGGPWGLALAKAAARAGSKVILCSRRPQDTGSSDIELVSSFDALAATPVIILAVPSNIARTVSRDLGDHLNGRHMVVHGVRGLSGDRLQTVSDIVREETPVRRLGALGGPVQADELAEGKPSVLVVASGYPDVVAAVRSVFQSKWLQVQSTPDLIGLEWSSALVGCLSIGVGFAQTRKDVSPGLLAALISGAVAEAAVIMESAGADPKTLYGLAGYGDLLASMALPNRPEVVLGSALAAGSTLVEAQQRAKLRIEAVDMAPRFVAYAESKGLKAPMLKSLDQLIRQERNPERIMHALFQRAGKA